MDPVLPTTPPFEELRWWLALYRAPGVGPARFRALITLFGGPRQVLLSPRDQLTACGLPPATVRYLAGPDWQAVDRDLHWLEPPGHHLLTIADPAYPQRLRETPAAPPLLFVRGQPARLANHQVALVGSRNPTAGGRQTAQELAGALAARGLTVTSGLALGIDAAAHRGALDRRAPTVAVMGSGPDRTYPARHKELADRIAANGALVTEFPPGTAPAPDHFPRRNRIISGLSLGVVVIEAAPRSGSLITARHALEQGREVFAVPGSIHNPLTRGCHQLIQQGAKLVTAVEDIIEELPPVTSPAPAAAPGAGAAAAECADLDPNQRRIMEFLGYEAVAVDTLVRHTGLTAEQVSSILLTLELRGQVASAPGGLYTRVPARGSDERKCT